MKTEKDSQNKKGTMFRFFYRLRGKPRAAKHYHCDSHCQVSTDSARAKTYKCRGGPDEQLAIIRKNFEHQFERVPQLYADIASWRGKKVSEIETCYEEVPEGTPRRPDRFVFLSKAA